MVPDIRLMPGIWDIPVPAESGTVLPNSLLVPLVGIDARGYRLGYGGATTTGHLNSETGSSRTSFGVTGATLGRTLG